MTKDDVLSQKQYIEVTNLMDKPLINTARKETQAILKNWVSSQLYHQLIFVAVF